VRKNGRVLLAFDPGETRDFEAGAFWVTEKNTKRLQSIYVDPLFRGTVGPLLADALKRIGVTRSVGPYSLAGDRFVTRHKFKKISQVKDEIMIHYKGRRYIVAHDDYYEDGPKPSEERMDREDDCRRSVEKALQKAGIRIIKTDIQQGKGYLAATHTYFTVAADKETTYAALKTSGSFWEEFDVEPYQDADGKWLRGEYSWLEGHYCYPSVKATEHPRRSIVSI
jgi:hypothetical protein